MIKKLLTISLFLLEVNSVFSDHQMLIWQEGSQQAYPISEIDSITFKDNNDIPNPDINTMPSDAKTLASKIFTGINIGNTLEAVGDWCNNEETCWGAAEVTQELINAYKKAGFNAIRIPVAWHTHESNSNTYEIDSKWMARVKEVVDYVIKDDLYVIINIHWDNGWLEQNCTLSMKDQVNKEQAALWKQIANTFRDYDEHLIFASANEPDVNSSEEASVLKSYHQTFVNTVRETGGNNAFRNLIIQGPSTAIDKSLEYDVVPTDIIANRLMYEVHFYPYTYALMEEDANWGNMHFFWGKQYDNIYIDGVNRSVGVNGWCNEEYVDSEFSKMKDGIVNKLGMPVILGEYAIMDRDLSGTEYQQTFEDSRAYYYEYVNRAAKNNGIVPFLWETPGGIFNRSTENHDNTIKNQTPLNGIMKGSQEGIYPF